MSKVITLLVIGLLGWYWWLSQKAKALAVSIARQHCQKQGLQFLDYTVVQKGVAFAHLKGQGLSLARVYEFEFTSTGEHRHKGTIRLVKGHPESITLEPWTLN